MNKKPKKNLNSQISFLRGFICQALLLLFALSYLSLLFSPPSRLPSFLAYTATNQKGKWKEWKRKVDWGTSSKTTLFFFPRISRYKRRFGKSPAQKKSFLGLDGMERNPPHFPLCKDTIHSTTCSRLGESHT